MGIIINFDKVKIKLNLILASEEWKSFSKYIWLLILLLSLWFTAISIFPMSRDFDAYNIWCMDACESMEKVFERDPLFGISCVLFGMFKSDPTVLVVSLWIFASLLLKFSAFGSETGTFIWSLFTYVAFFYITQETTQIRASFATATLGYAFIQTVNKNYFKSIILCLFAVAAHLSSLLFLPILLLLPILIKTKRRFIITVVVCQIVFILSVFTKEFQNLLITMLPIFLGFDARIETYLFFYGIDEVSALGKNIRVIFFVIISTLVLAKVYVSGQYDEKRIICGATCMTMMAILISSLSYSLPVISLRSLELFAVPMSLMVGAYMQSIENKYYADMTGYILIIVYAGLFFNSLKILT